MKAINRFVTLIIASLLLVATPVGLEAKRSAKGGRTTAVTKSKAGSKKREKTSKKTSGKTRRGKQTNKKQSRRAAAVWHPFASFESRATPTPYYVPGDSIASLKRKAAAGNREAQYLLGCSHFERRVRNTPADSADILAAYYWQQAAAQGHTEAMGNYGYCLRTGRGLRADTLSAVEWYIKSLLKGNRRLENLTARNAEHGGGFDAYVMARAIEQGFKGAGSGKDVAYYDNLAAKGEFTPALIDGARRYLAAGNTTSALEMLRAIRNPDDKTIGQILDMLSRAGTTDLQVLRNLAETEYPEAQLALSEVLLSNGDNAEGARWMYQAAQNGSDVALDRIVKIQTTPGSSLYDPYQAYLWLDMATESDPGEASVKALELTGDSAFADFTKALIMLDREDRQPDYAGALPLLTDNPTPGAEAMALLCEAKTVKKSKAGKTLKQMASKAAPLAPLAYSFINAKDAMKMLKKGAEAGDVASANRLGVIYFNEKKFDDAREVLLPLQQNAVMTRDASVALSKCE